MIINELFVRSCGKTDESGDNQVKLICFMDSMDQLSTHK